MKELSFRAKIYLYGIYALGLATIARHLTKGEFHNLWMLVVLCFVASLALLFKVEGATYRSHYTFSFLVYGFTFALYGTSATISVIAVSNLIEWLWNRPPWFIQLFNSACYILLMQIAGFIYHLINPQDILTSWQAVVALTASMTIFALLHHVAVGSILWLARGENFIRSGVFEFFSIMLDLTLLFFGALLAFAWSFNYFTMGLSLIPIYLIYGTLRVPALERQTEMDSKTGLFNYKYFKVKMENELNRANRFDRPLAVIMGDLDLLRNINNTYGHLAGDEVLIGAAKVLKHFVGEYDIVARFGGEEFAILLPETSMKDAYVIAEHIRKTIEETEFIIPTSIGCIRATMSFGIACRERFNQTPEEITHNADTALYQSKLSGRNRIYSFTEDLSIDLGLIGNDKNHTNVELYTPINQSNT
jgi:diguanylate cyclase (GGDEF)-like protein